MHAVTVMDGLIWLALLIVVVNVAAFLLRK